MLRVVELTSIYSDLKFLVLVLDDDCILTLIYAFFFIILDFFVWKLLVRNVIMLVTVLDGIYSIYFPISVTWFVYFNL